MGFLLLLIGLCLPRLTLLFIAILTEWFDKAYETAMWPILGFFFMPYTTLVYMGGMLNSPEDFGVGWTLLMVVAVLADLGSNRSTTVNFSKK